MGSSKELKKVKTYFKTALFLLKSEKSMETQSCTSKEVNELTLDANHSSPPSYSTKASPCDTDKPSVLPCEKETKALLPSNNKEVDEDNVHQPSSSSNLDFTISHDVE